MNPLVLAPVVEVVKELIDLIPNKNKRDEVSARLNELLLQAEIAANQGQLEINKVEAQHESIFVAGWRPFIGWTLGLAIFAKYIAVPIFTWLAMIYEIPAPPELNLGELITLIGGMLGMSTLRGLEKKKV